MEVHLIIKKLMFYNLFQGANPPYRDLSLLPFPAYFPGPSKRLNRPQKEKSGQFPVKTKELNLMNIVVEI